MLAASVIPTLMVGWLTVVDTSQLLTQDAQELAKERVEQLRLRVDGILEEQVRAVARAAQLPGFFELPRPEQRAILYALSRLEPGLARISVLSGDGAFLIDLRLNAGAADSMAAHHAKVQGLLQGAASIRYSEVYFVGPREVPALTVIVPSPTVPRLRRRRDLPRGAQCRPGERDRPRRRRSVLGRPARPFARRSR